MRGPGGTSTLRKSRGPIPGSDAGTSGRGQPAHWSLDRVWYWMLAGPGVQANGASARTGNTHWQGERHVRSSSISGFERGSAGVSRVGAACLRCRCRTQCLAARRRAGRRFGLDRRRGRALRRHRHCRRPHRSGGRRRGQGTHGALDAGDRPQGSLRAASLHRQSHPLPYRLQRPHPAGPAQREGSCRVRRPDRRRSDGRARSVAARRIVGRAAPRRPASHARVDRCGEPEYPGRCAAD